MGNKKKQSLFKKLNDKSNDFNLGDEITLRQFKPGNHFIANI